MLFKCPRNWINGFVHDGEVRCYSIQKLSTSVTAPVLVVELVQIHQHAPCTIMDVEKLEKTIRYQAIGVFEGGMIPNLVTKNLKMSERMI